MKTISIAMILCCFTAFGQNLDEVRQYRRIVKAADSLFIEREYQKSLNLYERAYKLCGCKYPYEQIRSIKDGNLIIRNRKKYNEKRK